MIFFFSCAETRYRQKLIRWCDRTSTPKPSGINADCSLLHEYKRCFSALPTTKPSLSRSTPPGRPEREASVWRAESDGRQNLPVPRPPWTRGSVVGSQPPVLLFQPLDLLHQGLVHGVLLDQTVDLVLERVRRGETRSRYQNPTRATSDVGAFLSKLVACPNISITPSGLHRGGLMAD